MKSRFAIVFVLMAACVVAGLVGELFFGSVSIEPSAVLRALFAESDSHSTQLIVLQSRLPRALTAAIAGGGLALCGLLMQRFFHNPLAGPSVLGISSGASLGVALVVLAGSVAPHNLTLVGAAFAGAMAVLALILLFSTKLNAPVSLLIFGLMVGYMVSALVTILQSGSSSESLRTFVFWGMGSFADLNIEEVGLLFGVVFLGGLTARWYHRHLDLWSLGENYAKSSGLNLTTFRLRTLVITGILTGIITAFCGPVAFIGLAVPHLARGLWHTGRHQILIPAVMLTGMGIGLACDLISRLPEGGLPLNAVTAFFGAPVVIALLIQGRRVF